jgi:hypothetical protein
MSSRSINSQSIFFCSLFFCVMHCKSMMVRKLGNFFDKTLKIVFCIWYISRKTKASTNDGQKDTKRPLENKSTSKIKMVSFFFRTSTACRSSKITLQRQQRKGPPPNTLAKYGFWRRQKCTRCWQWDLVSTERTSSGGILQATHAHNPSPSKQSVKGSSPCP